MTLTPRPRRRLPLILVIAIWPLAILVGCRSVHAGAAADPPARFEYFGGLDLDPAVPAPRSHLGYDIGEHFTRHADLVGYLESLAAASDRIRIERYGRTPQRRGLHLLTISHPDNLARLEEILERNRELTDPRVADRARVAETLESNPAIVWFSYNVHGNEPSPAECAIQLAYTMAAARNPEVTAILEHVVLVIDPMLNPDGHERYVSWLQNTMGAAPLPDPEAAEHDEPWPGGRTNHYHFDLNRDWLWLVQPESRQRLPVYRRYLPQLHVDFHEQSYRHPYFLGAGDEPYHPAIPAETRQWVERYGHANATAFDARGLVYSTAERFDYLYPGYGKVLPVFHGAVGMLAEKGGHGRAGLAIDVDGEYVLTLAERTAHHFLLSLSNLETTAALRREQLERFHRFFDHARFADELAARAFVIGADNDPARLQLVWDLCAGHGIEIHALDEPVELTGLRDYRRGAAGGATALEAGTWIIRTGQPLGRLAAALFDRETEVTDPDTYDITAWSVPVAFGLRAWSAPSVIEAPMSRLESWAPPSAAHGGEGDVAILVDARQHRFPAAAGVAARLGLVARFAGEAFVSGDTPFGPGSLIVHRVRNDEAVLDTFLDELAELGVSAQRTGSGLTAEGPVLGANANRRFDAPRALLLRGEPTSGNAYGQLWHLLDVVCPLPYTPVNADRLGRVDLGEYNVLIVPELEGSLSDVLGKKTRQRLDRWIRGGGALVAVGARASAWASREVLELEADGPGDGEPDAGAAGPDDREPPSQLTWQERRDRRVEDRVPGAALRATVDVTHPLAAGMGEWVGVLARGDRVLPVDERGWVVVRYEESPRLGGVISDRNVRRLGGTPLMTHHARGEGVVICIGQDVTFRGFQHHAMRLVLNAIVYGPGL